MRNPRDEAGASDRLARRSSEASTPQQHSSQRAPSPEEVDRLLENLKADPDTIRKLRFFESESKVALRERIQRAMIATADRAVKARSPRARERFWVLNADANALVLSNASEAELGEIVDILRREFEAAEAWERLEGDQR